MSEVAIYRSPVPDLVIPEVPVSDFCFENTDEIAGKLAIIDTSSGDRVTYMELRTRVNRAMNGLLAAGFKAGDVLALHLPNCIPFVVSFHAVASLGGTVTTSNPTYNASELGHQLSLTKARFLVTIAMFKDAATEAAAAAGVETVYILGEGPSFMDCEDSSDAPRATFDVKEQVVAIPFSSGTSGLPKGVELTHFSIVANLMQITANPEHCLPITRDSIVLGLLPLFHIFGLVALNLAAIRQGSQIILMPKFDPVQFLTLIQEHKITFVPVVPPIVLFLAKHPLVDKFDFSSVTNMLSGAAPLGEELQQECEKRLSVPIGQGYGLTELSPAALISPLSDFLPGSTGRLLANTEARIVDPESGASLGTGPDNRGELWIRGPQKMKGYHRNPEATAACVDSDGWFHTGDIAYVTDKGDFYIVDRLKELIKVKGFQVAPAELEALLVDHPAIADAAVIGVPDERAGEVPKAFVVKKPDTEVTAEDVMAFIAEKVSAYKKVQVVEFVDSVPKSASGKILRRILKDKEAEARAKAASE